MPVPSTDVVVHGLEVKTPSGGSYIHETRFRSEYVITDAGGGTRRMFVGNMSASSSDSALTFALNGTAT